MLRTAVYADHYGVRDGRYQYMDQGLQSTHYTLFPYTDKADAHRRAALLNSPVRSINASFHHGALPECFSGVQGADGSLMISAIKQGEDAKGTVLRCWESEGIQIDRNITLLGKQMQVKLAPYAVETMDEGGNRLDFMEWKKNSLEN